jgi:sugar transferase (PEP-CTERM/EpsH1 system associated)
MKIFMLVSRVPWPLEKGDKLRAYHQLKELAKHHEVYLCCLTDTTVHRDALNELHKLTPHVEIIRLNRIKILFNLFMGLFDKKPYQVKYFYQRSAYRKILRAIKQFNPDHIYCQLIRTSEYVKHLHEYRKTIDYMDALSSGQRRRMDNAPVWFKPLVREEAKRLTAYENLIFDYFDHHTIISEQDRQLIYHEKRNRIAIIPNGVNHEYFQPQKTELKYELIFTGNMSYPPNVDCAQRLAHEIMPLVTKRFPSIKLVLAGANPTRAVNELANPNIEVSGWLDDIRTAYNSASIFVAPMRIGSGLQNKLLEAMSMNLPCVSTPLAARPMEAIPNEHLLVGDSNEEIALHIITLLEQKEYSKKIAAQGRQFVLDKFNWDKSVQSLNELISQ